MKLTIEQEAEKYAKEAKNIDFPYLNGLYHGFIAGANSKYVQAEKIKEQMSLLSNLRCSYEDTYYIDLEWDKLEQQLKELEDGTQNN